MLSTNVPATDKRYDMFIIGSGPAGLAAAIYGTRADLKVAFIDGSTPGGKVTSTDRIENYPGFERISGPDLALNMFNQAVNLKAQYLYGFVEHIEKDEKNNFFIIKTQDNKEYYSKVVIVATGMKERRLNLPNEEKFDGKGISFCAVCDGSLYKNKDVATVGGGNSAVQEALYLAKIVNKIYFIHRRDQFRADKIMVDELKRLPNIEFLIPYEVVEYIGDERITGLKLRNLETKEEKLINISCVFPYIGFNPSTGFLKNLNILNELNQIETNKEQMTSLPGLFAAGDCTTNTFRQITTAGSDGTVAALAAVDYINKNAGSWNW